MKKLLLLASMLIVIGIGKSVAGQADLFSYDAVTIENQMAQLDQLEGYVNDNPGITLGEMSANGNTLATLVNDANGFNGISILNDKAFGIPGFFWGCILGPVGVVVVYLVAKEKSETKSAIFGCVVSTVISVASSIVYSLTLNSIY